jgi:AcrR family transcriptional regulator
MSSVRPPRPGELVRTKTPIQSDKILTAAARLFSTQRFDQVRMEDIAAEAEVGKGTLYRYFRDKEELYIALLARSQEEFMGRIEAILAGSGSPRERLEVVVSQIIEQFDEQPNLQNLIMRAELLSETGVPFPWQKARERLPRLLIELFEDARARGEFTVRDPELLVLMLLGGLRSVIRFGERPRAKGLARRIVKHFVEGANAGPGSASGATLVRTGRSS